MRRSPLENEFGYFLWTWPRTIGALLFGAAIATAAPTVDAQLRLEREHIILTGGSAPALVVALEQPWPSPITTTILRYTVHGREVTVGVTHPLGIDLEKGSQVTVYVDPSDPRRVALSDGHSSLDWQWLPLPLAAFGGLIILLALVGIPYLRWQRHWESLTLDTVTIRPPRIRHERAVVRRHDFSARLFFGMFAAGILAILCLWVFQVPGNHWPGLPVFAPFVVGLYLPAFSTRLEITPSQFLIYSPMRIKKVPRHSITGCGMQPDGTLALVLADHPPVIIPVGMSTYLLSDKSPKPYHRPQQLLTMAKIRAIVDALPAKTNAGSPGIPTTRTRYLALACVALSFTPCAWAVLRVLSQ